MIKTERLDVRYAALQDIDDIFEYISDDEVMKYERENYPTKESFSPLFNVLIENNLLYVVRVKGEEKVIGHIFLGKTNPGINNEYNIGYIFNPVYQGKGYCTEAAKALIDYGFEVLQANRIRAACNPENVPSWRVMEKAGLRKEGYFEKRFYIRDDVDGNPVYTDEVVYGIHVSKWKN